MSVKALIEFDDPAEHEFDAATLVLLDDKGQLLSQVSPNEILFANYDGLGDNSGGSPAELSKRGDRTVVFAGIANTGQVLGGILDFPNADASTAEYQNITDIVDDFAFRVKAIANVLTLVADRDIVRLISNIDDSEIRFYLQNQGGGVTRVKRQIIDSSGSVTNDLILGLANFSTDPIFNIAFSNDDIGNTLTYLNGELISTIASPSFDFTDCNFLFSNNAMSICSFDNVQLFKSNAITADFTFPFPEATTFVLSEQVMLTNIPLIVDEVLTVESVHSLFPNTELKFFGVLDGQSFYHDGANWAISNRTLAQSNTIDEIQAGLSSIPILKGIGKILQVGAIFKSTLGYATPFLESMTLTYRMAFKSGNVTLCNVFGTIFDNAGIPVVGATIRVNSNDKFINNVFVGPSAKAITNDQGKFSISLPETQTDGTTVDITIEYFEEQFDNAVAFQKSIVFEYKNRIIPNLPTCEISGLSTP